ncbi:MAG: hypothetical protein COV47_02420 [Candidatus Diapherotrites archaeon CG11_big_fil_rev_8_21_14_0_20_37_9]|nr:MAG: hypothetical protein COV47_02420 [Candidatus Diapherotrites archaeon CG11_big_fil_rev_8_21_14_0_20_37_9]
MAKLDVSIIEVIDKMVREGESEEKIIRTLKDLGVEPNKAKKLLLLGQADTFSLLKGEIKKIVRGEMEEEKPVLKKFIEEEAMGSADTMRQELTKAVISDLRVYEKDITGQSQTFQEQIQQNINRVNDLNERVKVKLNELGEAVRDVQVDMDEVKVKGLGSRNRIISTILWILGLVFGVMVAGNFVLVSGQPITIDSLILMTIMALLSVTMLFVATVI